MRHYAEAVGIPSAFGPIQSDHRRRCGPPQPLMTHCRHWHFNCFALRDSSRLLGRADQRRAETQAEIEKLQAELNA